MHKSKLIALLKTFDADEIKSLRRHTQGAAANTDTLRFFEYLYALYPGFESSKIKKEFAYKKLYGPGPYNDQVMRHLKSQLFAHIQTYIVKINAAQNPFQQQLALLQQYRKRNLSKLFEEQLREVKKEMDAAPVRDKDFYAAQVDVDQEFNRYLKAKQVRTLEPNIQQLSNNLDLYYAVQKIKLFIEALNYKNMASAEYSIDMMDEITALVNKRGYIDMPVLKVYYTALHTLTEPDNEEHFKNLKKYMFQYRAMLASEDLNDINTLARNFCIKRINKGQREYHKEVFDLYKFELEQQDIHGDIDMAPGTFKNIVSISLSLNDPDYTFSFINKYTPYLPVHMRESQYNYNMARYYFTVKKYSEVIPLLAKVEYEDVFLMLSAKALLVKTYFELNELSALDSLIQSFKALLQNRKKLSYHRNNYRNFLAYCERLIKTPVGERNKLLPKLSAENELVDKDWLVLKCTP